MKFLEPHSSTTENTTGNHKIVKFWKLDRMRIWLLIKHPFIEEDLFSYLCDVSSYVITIGKL